MKLCLAASGGGHMRQLLDLEPFWMGCDYFFVTEPTAMGHSVARHHGVEFVPHVALGQAKLGHPWVMVRSAMANLRASWQIVRRHRPDLVISTGAGSMFFTCLFARLHGAKFVAIDSFARFDRPSAFARIAGPLAQWRIAQAKQSALRWGNAECIDPLVAIETERPAKDALLFATVGATLPFPRLIAFVADAKRRGLIPQRTVIQTGSGVPAIEGVECVETLDFADMKEMMARADIAVVHGGTGSVITALQAGCRVIAIPRLFARGEHYDDHQLEITTAFAKRGLLAVARTQSEFDAALQQVSAQPPRMMTTDPHKLVARLREIALLATAPGSDSARQLPARDDAA